MNPFTLTNYFSSSKRVKERTVGEAYDKVNRWKTIINEGIQQEDGTMARITLNKAAEIIGIPKKSLEDYNQLFKKVSLLTDINQFANEKMGALRNYLRKNQKKLRKELKKANQNERKQKTNLQFLTNNVQVDIEEQNVFISSEKNLFKLDETSPIVSEQNFFQNNDTLYESDYESNPSPLGMPFSKKQKTQNSYIYSDEI